MYLVKTPHFIQRMFPQFIWRIPSEKPMLYLSFDDGPIPEVTPWVLEQLKNYRAQATFFCVGDNIRKHPGIYQQLQEAGHAVGHHTFHHLNGWQEDNRAYLHNVRKAAHLTKSPLFRPPYGRLKPKQAQILNRHYRIVMWDVLSGDFDPDLSEEACLQNVIDHAGPGSIVVFHDSLKAEQKLRYVLPRVLEHFYKKGYSFAAIS
jgi:peptidoglycan-N-acetylglucosamine deacetylase